MIGDSRHFLLENAGKWTISKNGTYFSKAAFGGKDPERGGEGGLEQGKPTIFISATTDRAIWGLTVIFHKVQDLLFFHYSHLEVERNSVSANEPLQTIPHILGFFIVPPPKIYPMRTISKHCIWLQIESKSDFETSRSLQKGPSPSSQPPPGGARLRDLQDKCMRQSQRTLKGFFPLDLGEAISLCRSGHRSQKDTCHPLALAGPWDISAGSTTPDSSPGRVSSASPGHFCPVPGASHPGAAAFQGWEKQCRLGLVHSVSGS